MGNFRKYLKIARQYNTQSNRWRGFSRLLLGEKSKGTCESFWFHAHVLLQSSCDRRDVWLVVWCCDSVGVCAEMVWWFLCLSHCGAESHCLTEIMSHWVYKEELHPKHSSQCKDSTCVCVCVCRTAWRTAIASLRHRSSTSEGCVTPWWRPTWWRRSTSSAKSGNIWLLKCFYRTSSSRRHLQRRTRHSSFAPFHLISWKTNMSLTHPALECVQTLTPHWIILVSLPQTYKKKEQSVD